MMATSTAANSCLLWAGLVLALFVAPSLAAVNCTTTESQVEGPYYQTSGVPVYSSTAKNYCQPSLSNYTKITVYGAVYGQGTGCKRPLNGKLLNVTVQTWQANDLGDYDNKDNVTDHNCRATIQVGKNGKFAFTTIHPAPYGFTPTCLRAPHIHIKVSATGYDLLTTQLYFANNTIADCGCSNCDSTNPALQLSFNAKRKASFNFVISKSTSSSGRKLLLR